MSNVLELAGFSTTAPDDEDYLDDYLYDSNDYGYQECDSGFLTDRPSRYVTRHILSRLGDNIEKPRQANGKAKIGTMLNCPICGRSFRKKSYQQKFCSDRCKVYYHNKRQVWY